jgi:hypothetical protein
VSDTEGARIAEYVAPLIRRLWQEGGFGIDPERGPYRVEDGLIYEVAIPSEELAVLAEVLRAQ